jgi:RHS repeat-associated protein
MGGSSYLDSVVMIDRDLTSSWGSAADGTLETRLYFAQNWRADTSVVLGASGAILRSYKYTAYGKRVEIDGGDYNRDGFVDPFDYDDFMACYEDSICADSRTADVNRDGFVDFFDYDSFVEAYDNDTERAHGGLRTLYAGYERDPGLETTHADGTTNDVYHVRHRVYATDLGRWTRRDPLGYVDDGNLFAYCTSMSIILGDEMGLLSQPKQDNKMPTPPSTTYTNDQCQEILNKCMGSGKGNEKSVDLFIKDILKNWPKDCSTPTATCTDCSKKANQCGYTEDKSQDVYVCSNTMRSPLQICETAAHELQHARDNCKGEFYNPSKPTEKGKNKDDTYCRSYVCREKRAIAASGQCCKNSYYRKFGLPGDGRTTKYKNFDDCLREQTIISSGACGTSETFRVNYDGCPAPNADCSKRGGT